MTFLSLPLVVVFVVLTQAPDKAARGVDGVDPQPLISLIDRGSRFQVFIDGEGQVTRRTQANQSLNMGDLLGQATCDELQLDSSQSNRLLSVAERLTANLEKLQRGQLSSEQREEVINNVAERCESINGILNQTQRKQFDEIVARAILFHQGVHRFEKAIGEELKLDSQQVRSFYMKLAQREREIAKRAVDLWLQMLNESERKIVETEWSWLKAESLEKATKIPLVGSLATQLNYEKMDGFGQLNQPPKSTETSLFPRVLTQPFYNRCGNLDYRQFDESKFNRLEKEFSEEQKFNRLDRFLNDSVPRSVANLSEEQIVELNLVRTRFMKRKLEVSVEVAERFLIPISSRMIVDLPNGDSVETIVCDWPEDQPEIWKYRNERISDDAKQARRELLNVLLPSQQVDLENSRKYLEVRRFGPAADLEIGFLREVLGISESKMKRLQSDRRQALAMLEDESQRAWKSEFDIFLKQIDRRTANVLRTTLGNVTQDRYVDLTARASSLYPAE